MENAQSFELPVLVVDDEPSIVRAVVSRLQAGGFAGCAGCVDSREVMGILSARQVGMVLLDLSMPHLSGESLLHQIVEQFPDVPVVMNTGSNEVATAVRCIKVGAYDYLVKPVEMPHLLATVKRALELRELRHEYSQLKEQVFTPALHHPEAFAAILTASSRMQAIFRFIETISGTSKPVLVTGESGVGKELISRAIHTLSGRSGPFVAVNVAGVDDNVFSDTLFGHIRGAFTGADAVRPGLLEQASAGTIFLDEIGDLSPASQVKLLRLVQEGEYFPLGADLPKASHARLLVATNKNLDALSASGGFRADLYYRLQIHQVQIPPLRERLEDLPLLIDHFLHESAAMLGRPKPTPPRELATLLATYSFPGNIRELEAMVYTAVSQHASGKLSMDSFKQRMEKERAAGPEHRHPQTEEIPPLSLHPGRFPTLKEAAEFLVAEALRRSEGNQSMAAEFLGITPSALNKRLHRAFPKQDA